MLLVLNIAKKKVKSSLTAAKVCTCRNGIVSKIIRKLKKTMLEARFCFCSNGNFTFFFLNQSSKMKHILLKSIHEKGRKPNLRTNINIHAFILMGFEPGASDLPRTRRCITMRYNCLAASVIEYEQSTFPHVHLRELGLCNFNRNFLII